MATGFFGAVCAKAGVAPTPAAATSAMVDNAEKILRPAVVYINFMVFIILSVPGCVLRTSRSPNSVRVGLASVGRDLFMVGALTAETGLDLNDSLRPMPFVFGTICGDIRKKIVTAAAVPWGAPCRDRAGAGPPHDWRGGLLNFPVKPPMLPLVTDAVMKPFVDPPGNTDILLVDDDQAICSLFAQVLSRAGYRVFTVDNAKSGLEVLKRMAIPVLITDLFMEGMDGLQFITRTRRNHPAVKIIAMSGGGSYEADECLRLATDVGADGALCKPFKAQDLLRAVGQMLPPPALRDI